MHNNAARKANAGLSWAFGRYALANYVFFFCIYLGLSTPVLFKNAVAAFCKRIKQYVMVQESW